ncbi:MAG: rRNA pseudouridine synthase [Thermoguttaceae bacterium]|nr:rRNA pseudouridine synthase [Thermoguttaceae bacterium]
MAKFNSSRSKTARNPGPVGRVKKFNQPKNRAGFQGGKPRRGAEDENRFGRGPRRRGSSDSMNFQEADDYVRPEVPGRSKGRAGNRPAKHFNPLNYLRGDEEDGIVSIPTPQFVEMDEDDWADQGLKRGASPFRKSVRGTKAAGKFVKDFRDAKSPRKGTGSAALKAKGTSKPAPERKPFGTKPRTAKKAAAKGPAPEGERLQKVLATAGFGSRRDCEEFILAGRVMVDREIVTELGTRVLPSQTIHLDGELVRRPKKFVYYALNKPKNVICTNDDPDGRRRALDYIHENVPGLFPVGRLDLHSEGLLLITNDGELANRLTHPSYEVPKVYRVRVSGEPTRSEIAQMCRGIHLAEGVAKAEEVKLRHVYRDGTAVLEVTLREGRNREIRRILARIGHNVLDLVRISIGDVKLGKIPLGEYRPLTMQEVKSLKKLVGLTGTKSEILAPSEPAKPAKPKRAKAAPVQEDVPPQEDAPAQEGPSPDALYEEWKSEF